MIEVINTEFYPLFRLTKDGGYKLNYEVIFWNTIMILKGAAHIFAAKAAETAADSSYYDTADRSRSASPWNRRTAPL